MLKPAICYKEQIDAALKEYFYTDEMMYYMGCIRSSLIEVETEGNGKYEWAIVDTDEKLIGYITYYVDFYSSSVYSFGLFSFDRGNAINGREVFKLLENLINTYHRVEFRAVSGNPATKGYDAFLKRHADIGAKHTYRDSFKDYQGEYHDDYVYEFINDKTEI